MKRLPLLILVLNMSAAHSISITAKLSDTSKTLLALGDSYTIGQSVVSTQNYPTQAVSFLNTGKIHFNSPEIIATTGWTTGDLIQAINSHDFKYANYDIVTLLIGVNNQYQGGTALNYRAEFITLLKKAIQLAGDRPSHVVVISIPDYSVTPFASARDKALIAKEIDDLNMINRTVSDSLEVNYIYITGETRKAASDTSLLADDNLHYSGKEYKIWATWLAAIVRKILRAP